MFVANVNSNQMSARSFWRLVLPRMARRTEASSSFNLRAIVMVVAAGVLVWLIVCRSFAAYLADAAPAAALWLNADEPEALTNLADQALNDSVDAGASQATPENRSRPEQASNAGGPAGDMQAPRANQQTFNQVFSMVAKNRTIDLLDVRAWAEAALADDPLNARALRILGQAAAAANDDQAASNLMRAAVRQSLHEPIAEYWLVKRDVNKNDYNDAIYYADALLRTEPQIGAYAIPMLAQLAERQQSRNALEAALSADPPWRQVFLMALPNYVTDARTPLDVLLALRKSPTPPTTADIGPYLRVLIDHKFYSLAYYTWLQFLSAEELRHVGLLFNGNFDEEPSGLPFDWQITPGAGVTVDIVRRTDASAGHALLVDFEYGRVDYHSVTELIMLAPGTYQFAGLYKGKLVGPRGMKWRVACVGGGPAVGESAMISGSAPTWKSVAFSFSIPATDCRAQYVKLDLDARTPSEQLVSGSMLFDELKISRVQSPPT